MQSVEPGLPAQLPPPSAGVSSPLKWGHGCQPAFGVMGTYRCDVLSQNLTRGALLVSVNGSTFFLWESFGASVCLRHGGYRGDDGASTATKMSPCVPRLPSPFWGDFVHISLRGRQVRTSG